MLLRFTLNAIINNITIMIRQSSYQIKYDMGVYHITTIILHHFNDCLPKVDQFIIA